MKFGNYSLRKLVQSKSHVKNWIPSILILGDVTPQGKIDSPGALQFVDNIKSDTCSNIYGYLHRGKFEIEDLTAISQREEAVKQYFDDKKYIFLTKCVQIEHSINRSGIQYLIQSAGMGGLEPNTLITGFPENYRDDPAKSQKFYDIIQQGVLLQKAILVTKPDDLFMNQETEHEGCIDIFSFSYEKGLMLIMPYFLKRSKQYRKCTLRLFILSLKLADEDTEEKEKKTCSEIREFLERYRLYPKIQIKTIFLTPTDFENFILQEYQLFMIQKKRMELINQSKLALAK